MIDQRTASCAALLLRVTIAGLFIAALYGKFVLKPIGLWWNGLLKAGYPEWVLAYTLTAEFASAILLLGLHQMGQPLHASDDDRCDPLLDGAQELLVRGRRMGDAARLGHHACRPDPSWRRGFCAEDAKAPLGRALPEGDPLRIKSGSDGVRLRGVDSDEVRPPRLNPLPRRRQ